jgi:hypothetical protein
MSSYARGQLYLFFTLPSFRTCSGCRLQNSKKILYVHKNNIVQVVDHQTVGHRLVSSTPIHGANSSKTDVSTWPSPIISQNKPHKCITNPKSKDLRKSKRGDDTSQGRQRALQKNSTTGIHKTALFADKEEGLVIRQSVGSSTFQKNSHADPGKK